MFYKCKKFVLLRAKQRQKKNLNKNIKVKEMQISPNWSCDKFLYVNFAILLFATVTLCNAANLENNAVSASKDNNINDFYQILHVNEVFSKSTDDDDNVSVITYQQDEKHQQLKEINETRTLEIKSKGFLNGLLPALLIVTQFKDSCRNNASLPSWKIINKGSKQQSNNEVFRLKINFEQRLTEGDFYFCIKSERLLEKEKHLGITSLFRLSR